MALLAFSLLVIVALGFFGAAFSSRARQERRSIASFHARMGQLSEVVQPEMHGDAATGEPPKDLFAETPTHVKVIGKTPHPKSSSTRRRSYRASTASGTSAAAVKPPSGAAPRSTGRRGKVVPADISEVITANSNQTTGLEADSGEAAAPVAPKRRSRSQSARPDRPVAGRAAANSGAATGAVPVKTEVLHFDDSGASAPGGDADSLARTYERKPNYKVLAVASAVAVVGLSTILYAVSSSHSSSSNRSKSVIPPNSSGSKSANTPVRSGTHTTQAGTITSGNGPLVPSSFDSSGATYFINSPEITLVVNASAPSWVEESATPGSTVLWEGIIPAGGSKTLSTTGPMWIKTGNVNVLSITANGKAVKFSAPPGVYTFTFRQGVHS